MKNKNLPGRRDFLKKALFLNCAAAFAPSLLTSCDDEKNLNTPFDVSSLKYVPLTANNPAIVHHLNRCEKCRDCVEACCLEATVLGQYENLNNPICIHCGACVRACDEDALTVKQSIDEVNAALANPTKKVVFSTAPSVRVALGELFNMSAGTYVENHMVGALRALGADYVVDVTFGADLTIMEEAYELVQRIKNKQTLPQFTSCCPAWVSFVEYFYPSLIPNLSTTKSPIGMLGSMVKTYFAQENSLDPNQIVHVAVVPCSAKKYEITRPELKVNGLNPTDYVITTMELAEMMKNKNIQLGNVSGNYDRLMGKGSGAGVIFGKTGGVMQAALRTAYYLINGTNPPADLIDLKGIEGLSQQKEATVNLGTESIKVAVINGIQGVRTLLDSGRLSSYQFIEVMACNGGCIGGAGQPFSKKSAINARLQSLAAADAALPIRMSHDNPEIKLIYERFLGKAGSTKAEELLHTSYRAK